ncbi:MAG: hypothetical protein M0Z50_15600, partial [Planctomycetia bacterium]|nr:hypothetical protein [Planctomycetia bacterium]
PRGNAVTFDYEPEHRLEENFHLLDFTHSPSHERGRLARHPGSAGVLTRHSADRNVCTTF